MKAAFPYAFAAANVLSMGMLGLMFGRGVDWLERQLVYAEIAKAVVRDCETKAKDEADLVKLLAVVRATVEARMREAKR